MAERDGSELPAAFEGRTAFDPEENQRQFYRATEPPGSAWRRHMSLRIYRVLLAISVTLNVLLIAAFWAYLHFEGVWSIIETAVGILG